MSGLLLLRRPSHVRCFSSRLSQVRHYALIGKPKASNEPKWVLPKTPARTRFAPSPTGYLHLGSLRTALYNYLLAQATGGQFIIRLEDTDQARLVTDAEQVLYDDLRWAGLHWDEGPDKGGPFGPYKQSERLAIYTQHAKSLLEKGHAFRCFCTKEDLEFNIQQATSSGGAAHYPGTCTHIEQGESDRRAANGEPHVIRFKSAEDPVPALDLVYGTYKKAEREDNFIIMKSDGFPTYHFANVVDDHFMEITHVIRGAEWLISTPKHVELYNALGWQPPNFAHVGLLVDAQRQKLSKRDMANIGIGVYRTSNVMPGALMNFSALLGWDPNLQKNTHLNKRGVMTLEEMKQNFTLKFTRGDIVVDLSKLKFFQKQLTRSLITGENPDRATLSKQIIQPIQAELAQFIKGFQEYKQDGASAAEPYLRELYDSISMRVHPPSPSEDYVLQVLKAWKGPVDDPLQFLQDNLFVFFRPSKSVKLKQYDEFQRNMARIMMLKPDRKGFIHAEVSTVLLTFAVRLSQVDEADWTSDKLGDIVKELTDSVKFYDTLENKDKFESAGWAFLRHGLINGKAGSALVPLMLLLGQNESVRRIRNARKIAKLKEEDLLREARRAPHMRSKEGELMQVHNHESRQQRVGGERDRHGMTLRNVEVSSSRSQLSPTSSGEPPFKLYLQKEKGRGEVGPFKSRPPMPRDPRSDPRAFDRLVQSKEPPFNLYLQKEKGRGEPLGEGPFKSQSPMPPAPRSPPRDPSEVQRTPDFLSFLEFRYGTRHLNLPKAPKIRGPNLDYVAKLPPRRQAQRQQHKTSKEGEADAILETENGGWAVPKPRVLQGKDAHSKSHGARRSRVQVASEYGRPLDVESRGPTKSTKRDATTAPVKAETPNIAGKIGALKPAGTDFNIDIRSHIEYLRGLNIALYKKNRAKEGKKGLKGGWRTVTRLERLKGTKRGPLSSD